MKSLHEIQRCAYRAFCDGDTACLLPLLDSGSIPPDIQARIYQNNVRETFRKTLATDYPVIERLVGDACFRSLCREYQRRYPSRRGSLQRFGASFAELLADLYAGTRYAYLPDMARLEWACEEVMMGPECRVTDLQMLARTSPTELSSLRLDFQEGIRLVESDYPVMTIWRANQPGACADVDLSKGAERVAVMRRGSDAVLKLVAPGVFQLIGALKEEKTFLDACDSVMNSLGKKSLLDALGSLMAMGA